MITHHRSSNFYLLTLKSSFLQTTYADGTHMSLEDAKRQCFQFTVAGQDTTAALTSSLILHVLQSPNVYSKLLAEIETF